MRTIRVGSRESRLAVAQTRLVMEAMEAARSDIRTESICMKTTGDVILDRTLDKVGGKGLFVRELDAALDDLDADSVPALALRKALRERVGELAEMFDGNFAVKQYRKGGGAK